MCYSRDRDYDDIDSDDPFNPQARRMAAHNPPRGQLRSFCSYSSGLGSQTSLQPPAQTISNAPVSEYMYVTGSPGPPSCPRTSRLGPRPQGARSEDRTWGFREPCGEEGIRGQQRPPTVAPGPTPALLPEE